MNVLKVTGSHVHVKDGSISRKRC